VPPETVRPEGYSRESEGPQGHGSKGVRKVKPGEER
jgi:hypothetical protein